MNKLQSVPFKVNQEFLDFLLRNQDDLVNEGILYPPFLSRLLNMAEVGDVVRRHRMDNRIINNNWTYTELFDMIRKDIQKAYYDRMLI